MSTEQYRPGVAPTEPVKMALVGEDGNAFFIIARLRAALRRAGADAIYVDDVMKDAMSGDYGHVLQVALGEIDDMGEDD